MNDYDGLGGDNEEIEYYAVRPNKTKIKKEINALFELGETMSTLSANQLTGLELPDNIHKAVSDVGGMPLTGARKRLLKYIAGQLHKIDVEPIREKLALIQNRSVHSVREHHLIEQWRDKLIHSGDHALAELVDEQPLADVQLIRQLVRQIKKETANGNPTKSSRLLYRYLKNLLQLEGNTSTENAENS